MNKTDYVYMIPWLCVPGVGLRSLEKIEYFRKRQKLSWQQLWQRLSILLSMNIISMKQLAEEKIEVVYKDDALYPQLLREIDQPPPLLFAKGNLQLLTSIGVKPSVAVVGTRRNTPYGEFVTKKIVEELTLQNVCTISGGMYGIDAIAHKTSIENNGETIAVLGSGVAAQGAYWQQLLCQQIIDSGGLVISEFFPWQSAQKGFFPRRNRVVAGLSNAVVVTEAAVKSGSLITAQYALDFGREVCAVPGSITNQFADGTTWLLNEGATLVRSGLDILKTFDRSLPEYISVGENNSKKNISKPKHLVMQKPISKSITRATVKSTPNVVPKQSVILALISSQMGITTDAISSVTKCSVRNTLQNLSELELQNRVVSQGQRWFLAT